MNAVEERQITLFNEQLKQDIRLRLVKTRHGGSRLLEDFCTALQKAAPKIHIVHEKDESDAPSELRIHSRIRYRAVPLGHELLPFLEALSWVFNEQAQPPLPFSSLLDLLTLPAELKLYIAEQCPFCPAVVQSLLPLAISSQWVHLTVIDAGLYLEEACRDRIQSVPTLVLDEQFRWTGSIKIQEVLEAMIHRDPSKLEADTLMNMIADGNAGLLSSMMLEKDMVFPALVDLLVHPKWPVRLGAMVTLETIAEENPVLAQKTMVPLWERFDTVDDKVKGDILYLVGEIDNGVSIERIQEVLNNRLNYDAEIIEAAEEALEKQNKFGKKTE
ncbi:MAG: thioredoxin family protein [Deltaproteobacteria bacterium]|nr:thioredoxin family protein [Deltaproteobacteria bacterium]